MITKASIITYSPEINWMDKVSQDSVQLIWLCGFICDHFDFLSLFVQNTIKVELCKVGMIG